jgi:hypothetical protein
MTAIHPAPGLDPQPIFRDKTASACSGKGIGRDQAFAPRLTRIKAVIPISALTVTAFVSSFMPGAILSCRCAPSCASAMRKQ